MPGDFEPRIARLEYELEGRKSHGANVDRTLQKLLTQADQRDENVSGFGIVGAGSTLITSTFTVPNGFTRAQVMLNVHVTASNTTGSGDYLYVGARINGAALSLMSNNFGPGVLGYCGNSSVVTIPYLLAGGTFDVECYASAGHDWTSYGGNIARLSALAVYMR